MWLSEVLPVFFFNVQNIFVFGVFFFLSEQRSRSIKGSYWPNIQVKINHKMLKVLIVNLKTWIQNKRIGWSLPKLRHSANFQTCHIFCQKIWCQHTENKFIFSGYIHCYIVYHMWQYNVVSLVLSWFSGWNMSWKFFLLNDI